ncbi:MAG: hypothetical protein ACXV5L_12835, partial [Thermoanaerobaculia bacterium]
MTVTSVPVPKASREITVSYLGDLLLNAGFIDDRQRAELEAVDKQWRQQARSKSRAEEDNSPFKAVIALNLTDASGHATRIDDFLLSRLI